MRYENEHRFRQTGLDGFRTHSAYNCHSSPGLLHSTSTRGFLSLLHFIIFGHSLLTYIITYTTPAMVWRPAISLTGAATSIIFVATNKTRLLSREKFACRDKSLLVATKYLSHQNIFVNKMFVATKLLWRQAYYCPDTHRVWRDKNYTCGSSRQYTATFSPWHLVSWSSLLNYSCQCSKVRPSAFFFLDFFLGCLLSAAHHNAGSGGHLRAPLPPVITRQLPCLRSLHNSRADRSKITLLFFADNSHLDWSS